MIDGSTQDFSANCNNDVDVDIGDEIKMLIDCYEIIFTYNM